jgi:hypothetical protein
MTMKATKQGMFGAPMVPSASAGLLVLAAALVLGSNAVLRAQTPELQITDTRPPIGTFYSLQNAIGGTNAFPMPLDPYPWLDLYVSGSSTNFLENTYFFDDRGLDAATLWQQALSARARAQQSLANSSIDPPDPGEGSGGEDPGVPGSPPVYMTSLGLCLWPPVFTSSNSLTLTLTNVDAGGINDLYYTTNLALLPAPALCLTNWAWLGRGYPGQSVFVVTNPPQPQCYFILGNAAWDSDLDGLPDAYESLVSDTPPNVYNVVSSDGYGTPDGWYLQHGLNPLVQGIATQDLD